MSRELANPMGHSSPLVKRFMRRLAGLLATSGVLLLLQTSARGELALTRDFDGPATAWELLETATPARIQSHQCVTGGARDNGGSERIVVAAPAGESVRLQCPTARIAVIPELQVRLWVRSSRPAVQLAARIALPRTIDPQTRRWATVIVRGASLDQPGHWQQLTLGNVPKLLAAEVRVLRSQPRAAVDPKEAYVDAVVLIVPGEPHGAEVVVDELEIEGIVLPEAGGVELASYPAAAHLPLNASSSDSVRLRGGILLVDDRPFVPRAIEWRGESFASLAQLGFNVVRLPGMPTEQQMAEARQHALWIMAVPPGPESLAGARLGHAYDRILAWYLADKAFQTDPGYALRWAEQVRRCDAGARPLIVAPRGEDNGASGAADLLLVTHPRLGRMSVDDLEQWLTRSRRQARPGTPVWISIPTQLGQLASRQAATLSGQPQGPPSLAPDQLEAIVRSASVEAFSGFVFGSESSLSEPDDATRQRAALLALLNRRLQLIDPWLAGGKVNGQVRSTDGAWAGVLLQVDRARLVVPLPAAAQPRGVDPSPPPQSAEITFLVPGVPESSRAFMLSPVALRSLPTERVAGGTRLVLPHGDACAVFTEDPRAIQNLRQYVAREGPQVLRLERELVAYRAARIGDIARRVSQLGFRSAAAASSAAEATAQLRQLDIQLAAGNSDEAHQLAVTASRLLAQAAAELRRSLGATATFDSHPLEVSDELLADYAAFQQDFDALRGDGNLLYGGDFEDLGHMTHVGWQHFQDPQSQLRSHVELSADRAKHGQYSLSLQLARSAPSPIPAQLDPGPVWVVSPSMPVEKGQILAITGWVRVDQPLEEGGGLEIVDSLGSAELSLSIRHTSGWQPFQMVRAVPEATELRLSFALASLGSAQIDAVMVRALHQPIAHRLPPVTSPRAR